ncbi:MAG TPA: hypothetical protein VGG85_11100 [Terracidiphilus sp.]|jgi:hypothetical protein
MPKKPTDQAPRTAGELRSRIAKAELNWQVDARLRDADLLRRRPRGGSPVAPADSTAPTTNPIETIRQHPPTNPFLRARWEELKWLPPQPKPAITGSVPSRPTKKEEEPS